MKDLIVSIDFFFFQAEDGIRDYKVTGVQTCALPISPLALRAPCIEIHARLASATEQEASAWGSAGPDSREGDEPAEIELTYSITSAPIDRDRRSAGWFCA